MLSLRCFSLQLPRIEVNLFNHCRREQELRTGPARSTGLFFPGVWVTPAAAAAVYSGERHPQTSCSHFGFPEIWLKALQWKVIPAEAVGEAAVTSQAAQKLCWQRFCYYGLLCLLLFLSLSRLCCMKKFPYSSFTQQNLNQSSIRERNGVFSESPRQPLLWGSWVGKATTHVRAGGQRGHRDTSAAAQTVSTSLS